MAVPFSNTHLRVPRGFGAILEGLTREILRDQPKDIPKYATVHFEALLKQREESGIDPSDWAAKLEDRYYNNHSFKTSEKDLASKTSVSNENAQESQTEDYSSHSEEDASLSTTKSKVPDDSDFTKSTEEREDCIITHEDSVNGLANVEPYELSGSEEVKDPAFTPLSQAERLQNENSKTTGSHQTRSHSDLELLSESANIDVCAEELAVSETSGEPLKKDENEVDDRQITDRAEGDPVDVNFCATDLALEEKTAEDVSFIKEGEADVTLQLSETRLQSPVSQLETTEHLPQEAETKNEASEVEASIENAVESESQQTMDDENEQAVNINMTTETEDHLEPNQEEELEVERQEETKDDEEEANESDLNDYDDNYREDSVENIKALKTSTELENLEAENNYVIDDEDKSNQKEYSEEYGNPAFREETHATDEIQTEEHQDVNDKDDERDLSQLTQSDMKTLELEEQSEALDSSTNDMTEDNEEEQQKTEKVTTASQELHTEAKELVEEEKLDHDIQEDQAECEQDSIIPDLEKRADQRATGFQEKQQSHGPQRDTSDPEGETTDKQEECSRPQEEEDIMDIPLDDPEANRAAAKIQAGFRGHMTRKKMKPEDKTEGEERPEDRGQ